MKNKVIFALTGIACSLQLTAFAAEHRLAFSKANNVEVFATETNNLWCQPDLNLRFVFGGQTADLQAVESLLPKLGVLFAQQCPAALSANWQAMNESREVQANGTASKEGAWLMKQSIAAAPEEPVPANNITAGQDVAPASAEEADAAQSTAADNSTQASVEPKPSSTSGTATETKITEQARTPTDAPEEQPVVAQVSSDAPSSDVQIKKTQTKAVPEAPKASVTINNEPVADIDFAVNGWKPASDINKILSQHPALLSITDQNNCITFLPRNFDLGQQGYSIKSTGVDCIDGYLQGNGRLEIIRPDGAHLLNQKSEFVHGFPMESFPLEAVKNMPLVHVYENGGLLFMLQKDSEYNQYFLLHARHTWRGKWSLNRSEVYALTERADDYRTAENIRSAVLAPVSAYTKSFPGRNSYTYTALNELSMQDEHKYYRVGVSYNSRSKVWSFDPNRATNYLFRNEERAAAIAKREAERKAYEERLARERKELEAKREREQAAREASSELQLYSEALKDTRTHAELASYYSTSLSYDRGNDRRFKEILWGGSTEFSSVVYINKVQNNLAWASYPYTAAIKPNDNDKPLDKGWYFIEGTQSMNNKQRDELDMPLTLVAPNDVIQCQHKACEDVFTPLNRTRLQLRKPNWTPEAAQQVIEAAEKGSQP